MNTSERDEANTRWKQACRGKQASAYGHTWEYGEGK